jgi:hypothetical protein
MATITLASYLRDVYYGTIGRRECSISLTKLVFSKERVKLGTEMRTRGRVAWAMVP